MLHVKADLKSDQTSHRFHPTLASLGEIQARLQRRYLDRLAQRVKRMRRLLLEREWHELRNEARQLRENGQNYGFESIIELADAAAGAIPDGIISRLKPLPQARLAVEILISAIDRTIAENSVRIT